MKFCTFDEGGWHICVSFDIFSEIIHQRSSFIQLVFFFLKVVAPSFSWQYQQNRKKKQKHLCSGLNVRCPTWARVFEHLVPNWWISVKPLAGGSNWRKWVIESRPLSFIAQLHFFLLPDSCDDRVIYVVWFDVCENIKKLACSWFMLKILIKNRLSKM